MDDRTLNFDRLRPRLIGIAYRMLGSSSDAEDVVQDAWLRWHEAGESMPANAEAWLVTITTRLAIDRLRAAKSRREQYVGFWLPEPILTGEVPSPAEAMERADDLSVAFMVLLERLSPEARAAFLLREVFDAGYDELATVIGKSEDACRQIVHRAKSQLKDERPRFTVSKESHERMMQRFGDAMMQGDFDAMKAMLAEDAELIGDGGGKATAFPRPINGARQIAQLFHAAVQRFGTAQRIELIQLNGQLGVLRFINGLLVSAEAYETDGERILRVHVQRNPDKLIRIIASLKQTP